MNNYKHHEPPLLAGDLGYLPALGNDSTEMMCCQYADAQPRYTCTRQHGHDGVHAAHGNSDEQYASWDANDS